MEEKRGFSKSPPLPSASIGPVKDYPLSLTFGYVIFRGPLCSFFVGIKDWQALHFEQRRVSILVLHAAFQPRKPGECECHVLGQRLG